MSERFLKIITTNKNNTCFVRFILLEFLSCSLDVYFHQCVSAKLHRTKLGAFWLPAGGGLPRSALNGRRGWGAYQRYPGAFKRLHWTPSMMACACLIYSQIQNTLLYSTQFGYFCCKHWTHFHDALIHWTCTRCKHIKPPHTSALSEPCKWLSFILSILDREAFHVPSVQCRICWSSNQAGRVVSCCMNVELEPLIRWSNVTYFS